MPDNITVNETIVTIEADGDNNIIVVRDDVVNVLEVAPAAVVSLPSTLSSAGDGASLVKTGVGVSQEIRSLIAGNGNIEITQNTSDVTLTVSARTDSATAGEIINGHRAVIIDTDGKLYHADSTDLTKAGLVVGVSMGAALEGQNASYQFSGIMTNAGWNLTPLAPVYFTSTGVITNTVPDAYIQRIGTALTATSILIKVENVIKRAN